MRLRLPTKEDYVSAFKFIIATIPCVMLKTKKKNIWIVAERPDNADDNGWIFYNWVRRNHPNQEIYFILDKHAPQYNDFDNHMIPRRSIKHYAYYMASNMHLNTMFQSVRPSGRTSWYYEHFFKPKLNFIYLRHGIHKDGLEMHSYKQLGARLFICGAEPEYQYFKQEGGYPDGNLVLTGLARFDDLILHKTDKKYILVLPTWRRYIFDATDSEDEKEKKFVNSDFYKHYQALINDDSIINFLKARGYTIKFCLHAQFKRFRKHFTSHSEIVSIIDNDYSIHSMLCETSLLITDYSSVFFDAAYINKPIIFYHFDYAEFREKHFSKGYFSYDNDGMGPIAKDEDEVYSALIDAWDGSNFIMTEEYAIRASKFFPVKDANNCKRIYEAILAVEGHS